MSTLIIGGGLSGLALAYGLERAGQEYLLLEARDRFGGRIATQDVDGAQFDMGPAWFWPGQDRIAALVSRLGLQKFAQYATGQMRFEHETGRVQQGFGYGSMQGSWRLAGGLSALTDALAARLPAARTALNSPAVSLSRTDEGICATVLDGRAFTAERAVLALPPRIAAGFAFDPVLPEAAQQAMADVPTWMAGQAKAIAVYDRPFWREAGLSGDAMSRVGPMVEIHDASPSEGGPYALFGFIGVPPAARSDQPRLRAALEAQLTRLFGPEAAAPRALLLKDWAFDPLTATAADAVPLHQHPAYGLPAALAELWDGRLIFAGTEVAKANGGFIEGALEAAEMALAQLDSPTRVAG
ncbi:MAG: NAD(P)/FAD-dependent oxidoreductase [Pseudomonadota bacterium]